MVQNRLKSLIVSLAFLTSTLRANEFPDLYWKVSGILSCPLEHPLSLSWISELGVLQKPSNKISLSHSIFGPPQCSRFRVSITRMQSQSGCAHPKAQQPAIRGEPSSTKIMYDKAKSHPSTQLCVECHMKSPCCNNTSICVAKRKNAAFLCRNRYRARKFTCPSDINYTTMRLRRRSSSHSRIAVTIHGYLKIIPEISVLRLATVSSSFPPHFVPNIFISNCKSRNNKRYCVCLYVLIPNHLMVVKQEHTTIASSKQAQFHSELMTLSVIHDDLHYVESLWLSPSSIPFRNRLHWNI